MFFFALSFIFSCNNEKKVSPTEKKITDSRFDEHMQRSRIDTLALLHNVNEYLRKLKENKIDSALDMLYEASGDTVLPASDKCKAEVRQTIKNFPVLDYNIERVSLFSETDTEVRYSIKYFEKEDNNAQPNTIQCVINPRRVGYYWYLTIPPSAAGDILPENN